MNTSAIKGLGRFLTDSLHQQYLLIMLTVVGMGQLL